MEDVSGARHGKLRGVLKPLILLYLRLEIFGGFSVKKEHCQIYTLSFGFSARRESREELLKWSTDTASSPLLRMRVVMMQQKDSICDIG